MVAKPASTPVTTPVPEPTLTIAELLLVQVPRGVPSVTVIVCPEHTVSFPPIGSGNGFTVTSAVAWQPVINV